MRVSWSASVAVTVPATTPVIGLGWPTWTEPPVGAVSTGMMTTPTETGKVPPWASVTNTVKVSCFFPVAVALGKEASCMAADVGV